MTARLEAVLFDVDGTLAETEELHRAAFNAIFPAFDLDWVWSRDLYRDLLRVTGGKERIRHYADTLQASLDDSTIAAMHAAKTTHYTQSMTRGQCALRPGVAKALDVVRDHGRRLAIATTTSHANVEALLEATLGPEGRSRFEVIVAGDDVPRKKPASDVYEAVLSQMRLSPKACLAIEDSANGLAAALAAGIETWITPSLYTAHEQWDGAGRVLSASDDLPKLLEERLR